MKGCYHAVMRQAVEKKMLLLQQSQMCSQISEELNISAEGVSYEIIFSPDTKIVVIIVQYQQSIELNGGSPCRASVSVRPPAAQ